MASAPSTPVSSVVPSSSGRHPAWEIAELFPDQGDLRESDYLRLTDHTNRLVEFINGKIEVLPMPTIEHQRILVFLFDLLRSFILPNKLGEALVAPLRVRVAERRYREPDVVFLLAANAIGQGNQYWDRADLVMEVISEDKPERDLVDKRREYAEAGIGEFWIADPRSKTITVLRLDGGRYVTYSEAVGAGKVRSALLEGFAADVAAVFAAGRNG